MLIWLVNEAHLRGNVACAKQPISDLPLVRSKGSTWKPYGSKPDSELGRFAATLLICRPGRGIGLARHNLDFALIFMAAPALQKPKLEISHQFSQMFHFRISTSQIPRHEFQLLNDLFVFKTGSQRARTASRINSAPDMRYN
ncbi:hypothetical protein WHZ77_29495 [Bradyrhizobium sp. A5]|uniref:hypothetical protein n=1 Tax=Bradyrhizobium sp. A5 TaxID=3133696 RepID=UPI0032545561